MYEMDGDDFQGLVTKQQKGVATLSDAAKIRKYKVQRFFRAKIGAKDVEDFDRFRRPIFTRAFHKAFPHIVRKRIDTNLQLMQPSLDDFNTGYDISDKILQTLEKMGYQNMGVAGEKLDLKNMTEDARLVRESRSEDPRKEFKCYVESAWGYKLKSRTVGSK